MTPSDCELMHRVQNKDAEAFDVLFERYLSRVTFHLSHISNAVQKYAEDLAQEVFLRVWNRAGQWRGEGTFKAWLFRMATNLALSHLRKAQTVRERPLDMPDDLMADEDEYAPPRWFTEAVTQGPDAEVESAEMYRILRGMVDGLPEEKRDVFRLVYDAELEIRDAAKALGIPEGTVKSRLFHGKQQLAREWRDMEQGDFE